MELGISRGDFSGEMAAKAKQASLPGPKGHKGTSASALFMT